ncbi:hypothetical protein [Paenibacillus herberti]|uniref:hypothetical protein n=1 Tax=Paenibacillus herberti TaxID=1619309 RepID=UPI001FECDF4B|nr:hypothetical protein [Paenibacillus herberti]
MADKFLEIDVERINIVDKQGKLKMSLFESEHMPDPFLDGKSFPDVRQGTPASGIMFYNQEGDECGGLIFGSEKDDNGDYESSLSLTFDQYKQDQILQMSTYEKNGIRNYGFSIYDRPNIPLSETIEKYQELQKQEESVEKQKAISETFEGHNQRAFFGKSQNGEVAVCLMDSKGKDRIRMVIDVNDVPRMEFLNEKGEVVYKLPPE